MGGRDMVAGTTITIAVTSSVSVVAVGRNTTRLAIILAAITGGQSHGRCHIAKLRLGRDPGTRHLLVQLASEEDCPLPPNSPCGWLESAYV